MAPRIRERPTGYSQDRDILIAVMGPTGAGKSTFIKTITGRSDIRIGHGLTSETSKVQEYRYRHNGLSYVLVDTPGFDDTYKSNTDVVEEIVTWLTRSYKAGARLKGIIYAHRICDGRMQGSSFANLRMFRKLCGSNALQNVVLATSFWNDLPLQSALQREHELKTNTNFWARMIQEGSQVVRLPQDRNACLNLLEAVSRNHDATLQVQNETVIQGLQIHETAAMRTSSTILQAEERRMRDEYERSQRKFRQEVLKQERQHRTAVEAEVQKGREEEDQIQRRIEQLRNENKARIRDQRQTQHIFQDRARSIQDQIDQVEQRIQLQKKALQEKRKIEERKLLQQYYGTYRCRRRSSRRKTCDNCGAWIRDYYYHCCHCRNDDYDHCVSCGKQCPVADHPVMSKGECPTCVVM